MIGKNNIFNIRAGQAQWLGMTGTRRGFVEFETREHGIRAWLVLMRRNRQLARRVGAFDKDVKLVLSCILSNLLVTYGTDKD